MRLNVNCNEGVERGVLNHLGDQTTCFGLGEPKKLPVTDSSVDIKKENDVLYVAD
ncbi:hypothetical protein WOLCODRAFT_153742 [Wolfiporia cocos MD-104 SS10]|uniref:Uncharacterized protein n=1 Tax=Wolfiporia cocos (strain MD-104) TaxID=742152 RepID=A0A2H3JQA8_WOLCO|nr:hypothetical protein WOLCODRAFT_153742 [Wolfiporia cocos MD-104 SS10]